MIDKIELRIPYAADFRKPVTELLRRPGAARQARHYSGVLDLRPQGLDALLHYSLRHGDRAHKLELLDTGEKPYSELVRVVEDVTDYDSKRLEFMRLDLCADVPNVPVSWFHANARFRHKQLERRIGGLKHDVICRRTMETITAGRRPNVIRIYDKVAECRMQFRKLVRRQSKDADPLDFVREFGFAPDNMLTRIERQYGGGRFPEGIRTFADVTKLPGVNPFEIVELLPRVGVEPDIEEFGLSHWCMGMHMRTELRARGYHGFRRWLAQHANGNAARTLKYYEPFLQMDSQPGTTMAEIVRLYRESTVQQLAA